VVPNFGMIQKPMKSKEVEGSRVALRCEADGNPDGCRGIRRAGVVDHDDTPGVSRIAATRAHRPRTTWSWIDPCPVGSGVRILAPEKLHADELFDCTTLGAH
jgi:hypothetical protein